MSPADQPLGTRFSSSLWEQVLPVRRAIIGHPFLTGLHDGSLPEATFRDFLEQDGHFLTFYARALRALAVRCPDPESALHLHRDAAEALAAERAMQTGLLAELGPPSPAVDAIAPTTLSYGSFLVATALSGSLAEGLAAVLPCYWSYLEVGRELASRGGSPSSRYQRWIDAYVDPDYQTVVDRVRSLLDSTASALAEGERRKLEIPFRRGMVFEWMFWEASWHRERWPL